MFLAKRPLTVLLVVALGCAPGMKQEQPAETGQGGRALVLDSVQRAERGLWEAVHRQDSAAFGRLLAPDYVFFSAHGNPDRPRARELEVHFGGRLRLDSMELYHWRAAWLDDSAVVLHYYSRAWGALDDTAVTQLAGVMAAWRRRAGQWQAVARTEWEIDSAAARRAETLEPGGR